MWFPFGRKPKAGRRRRYFFNLHSIETPSSIHETLNSQGTFETPVKPTPTCDENTSRTARFKTQTDIETVLMNSFSRNVASWDLIQ